MGRFRIYTDAEKRRAIATYRKARAAGAKRLEAARKAGASMASIEKWIEAEAYGAPVAIVRDRACLGGCGNTIRSDGPHRRLCDNCSAKIGSLPRAWSA